MPIATKTAETVQFLPHEPLACAFGPRRRESNAVNHQLIPALRHTVAQRPGSALDWFELGRAYLGTDNPRCAADAFRAALKNDAGLLAAKAGLARALTLEGYCIEAAQACFEGLTADAASMPLHRALAESLMQASLLDQAWKVVRTAISLDSGGVESSILSAAVLYQQDWIDGCLATLAKVLEIAPCHPQARQLQADALRVTRSFHAPEPRKACDPDAAATAHWQTLLEPGHGLKVGLIWANCRADAHGLLGSLALADCIPLAGLPGVTFFSLQHGDAACEAVQPPEGMHLVPLSDAFCYPADRAAAMCALDLVIAVDCDIAQEAASSGCHVWILMPEHAKAPLVADHDPRSDRPPVRFFRQRQRGQWQPVVQNVATALRTLVDEQAAAGRLDNTQMQLLAARAAYEQYRYPEAERMYLELLSNPGVRLSDIICAARAYMEQSKRYVLADAIMLPPLYRRHALSVHRSEGMVTGTAQSAERGVQAMAKAVRGGHAAARHPHAPRRRSASGARLESRDRDLGKGDGAVSRGPVAATAGSRQLQGKRRYCQRHCLPAPEPRAIAVPGRGAPLPGGPAARAERQRAGIASSTTGGSPGSMPPVRLAQSRAHALPRR